MAPNKPRKVSDKTPEKTSGETRDRTPTSREILDTEWDILDALWQAERATAREVTERIAPRRAWAYSTVKTLLDRMVDKRLVEARQVGNVWEYTPGVPRQKAQRWAWRRLVDVAFRGATAPTLAFVARESLNKKDRAELRALLDRLEQESSDDNGNADNDGNQSSEGVKK